MKIRPAPKIGNNNGGTAPGVVVMLEVSTRPAHAHQRQFVPKTTPYAVYLRP
jgi:hypothetical protein